MNYPLRVQPVAQSLRDELLVNGLFPGLTEFKRILRPQFSPWWFMALAIRLYASTLAPKGGVWAAH